MIVWWTKWSTVPQQLYFLLLQNKISINHCCSNSDWCYPWNICLAWHLVLMLEHQYNYFCCSSVLYKIRKGFEIHFWIYFTLSSNLKKIWTLLKIMPLICLSICTPICLNVLRKTVLYMILKFSMACSLLKINCNFYLQGHSIEFICIYGL